MRTGYPRPGPASIRAWGLVTLCAIAVGPEVEAAATARANASAAPPAGVEPGPTVPIENGGFEGADVTQGWAVVTYGAAALVASDTRVFREGHAAVRISAESPSDTALGQNLSVRPGRWHRLRGWVRTQHLDPRGATVFGTILIQSPAGNRTIAAAPNHAGDTDWTQIVLPFVAPADGAIRVSAFFVGFGKGTGTAWFDGVSLEEMSPTDFPVTVTLTPNPDALISPMQYGQFVEYLCDLVPGMWAEKLDDGGFEGLSPQESTGPAPRERPFSAPSPYLFHHVWQTDFRERRWHPCGATNRATYELDPTTRVGGRVSQKVSVAAGPPCTVGIAQDGVRLDGNIACAFTCYMRQEGLEAPVAVMLRHREDVSGSAEFRPTVEWTKFKARFTPSRSDPDATLAITFRGPGTLWIDSASLMPEDSVGGWRRDVVDAVRALRPGVIRFGGSALEGGSLGDFEWRATIGDPDRRAPFRAWGGLQPAGAGLEEFVQFCRAVEAEPLICVRYTGRTPEDARDEVQYFNGDPGTPMGSLRARNGHPEPYGVRLWQVGNEIGERAHPEYASRLAEFCAAMKRADAGARLLSSYPAPDRLRSAGAMLDFTCPHQYDVADLVGTEQELDQVASMIATDAPDSRIKIAVTEWNTTAGDEGLGRGALWSLANALACSRYHNLLHRHSGTVEIANRSNLTNSFCSGVIQTWGGPLYLTPTYYAQQLYATLGGNRPLKLVSEIPTNQGPDFSATLSPDGDTVTLFAVNDGPGAIERRLEFPPARGPQQVRVWELADTRHAGEPDVTNGYEDPRRIAPIERAVEPAHGTLMYSFPAYSLTVLRFGVGESHRTPQ